MGTARTCSAAYPWEQGLYRGGIETVEGQTRSPNFQQRLACLRRAR